jgi:lipoprotein signal peptidase
VRRRRRLACAAALVVLASTLVHDAVAATAIRHARPFFVLVLAGMLAVALLALAPRIRSWVVALGSGVAAGGALATLVSGFAWAGGVPDPLVRGGVAFNLADVAIAVGDALLVVGVCVHAWTNRARLTQPVSLDAQLTK